CAVVPAKQLVDQGDGTLALTTYPYTVEGVEPCPGEPFTDQPTAAFCTAFQVGHDLIATAGHCVSYDVGDPSALAFVFGFIMTDAATAVVTFDASQVYWGNEVIDYQVSDADYAIVRVDRPITAPGAAPLPIRRMGTVPEGTQIGVIGHPWGLPLKLAFGETTTVQDSSPDEFFIANLDTYGGNSGSPVFNAESGLVEGILVRGLADFDYIEDGDCFRSSVVEDEFGSEEATKATAFADIVFNPRGQLVLDQLAYQCEDTVHVGVADASLEGAPNALVEAFTTSGDRESLTLPAVPLTYEFAAEIPLAPGAATPDDGTLQAAEDDALLFLYIDEDNGTGSAVTVQTGAIIDCTAPMISDVAVVPNNSMRALVTFTTNEGTFGRVEMGGACGEVVVTGSGGLATLHEVEVAGLTPLTAYRFRVFAEDPAGNQAVDDNGGACYDYTTPAFLDHFTESFFDGVSDLPGRSVLFSPDGTGGYSACTAVANEFPAPAKGRRLFLRDDDFLEYPLHQGKRFPLFGVNYDRLFIGSNGYITFGEGDSDYYVYFENHFRLPRISAYYADLLPSEGGEIRVMEYDDRVAVTYDDVSDYFYDRHSFQVELFWDGRIRMTWLKLTRPFGIVGLSSGSGIPDDFEESDLSAYAACLDPVGGPNLPGRKYPLACGLTQDTGGQVMGDLIVVLGVIVILFFTPQLARRPAPCGS
ncbi:MAG: trypsin-like peptidase domain-containing protein, partial [Candidatus Hydrogenedentes bacterium]|nr:trypsin-like peptidase domain-containing protein [Candidatus Hydrogenedentota bacterium]